MLSYTFIGIVCSVVGNFLISLALNIQKYAHTRLQQPQSAIPETPTEATRLLAAGRGGLSSPSDSPVLSPTTTDLKKLETNYLGSPYWWLGAVVMTIGESGNFIAYGFAPVSVVSPLGIITIISNCTIAPLIFHEPLRLRDLTATMLASFGVLLVIVSSINSNGGDNNGNKDPEKNAADFIYEVLTSPSYLYYVITTLFIAGILIFQLDLLKNKLQKNGTTKIKNLYTFGNILLVAIFGAHTAMATKCLSTLIEFSGSAHELLSGIQTYYLLMVLVLTAICQIKYLNNSLRIETSTKVIPTHFVFFTISVLTGSAIVFKDQNGKQSWQVVLFFVGCVLTFVSVFLIAGGSKNPADISNDEERRIQDHLNFSEVSETNDNFLTGISHFDNYPQNGLGATKYYSMNTENNDDIKRNSHQYWEFQFKVPSLHIPNPNQPSRIMGKKDSKMSLLSAVSVSHGHNNILTDSLNQSPAKADFYTNQLESTDSVLSHSTSINESQNIIFNNDRAIDTQFLMIPKTRAPALEEAGNDSQQSQYHNLSRSFPGEDMVISNKETVGHRANRRSMNRSRSFNRLYEFNNSKSELVGIPGSGSVLLNKVLSSTLNRPAAETSQ
ncbi:hypothetical protein DASC09_023180 [Saccharomycopsis crataegensis]|uniref:Uncharacterized protein n=1 Tax=Saccharomycopsis crataegensis TaxID=43959 RepID=A0AAV5QLD6_9ASCO|nr:hypothetical protein DASC09_023180 [Saccharomycopsis crataegensis]